MVWRDLQAWKLVPLFGKFHYWWFGYGKKSQTKRSMAEIKKMAKEAKKENMRLDVEDKKLYLEHIEVAYKKGWINTKQYYKYKNEAAAW